MMHFSLLSSFALATLVAQSHAFCVIPIYAVQPITTLNLFGNLGDAFKNDDSLGKKENAGLKGVS